MADGCETEVAIRPVYDPPHLPAPTSIRPSMPPPPSSRANTRHRTCSVFVQISTSTAGAVLEDVQAVTGAGHPTHAREALGGGARHPVPTRHPAIRPLPGLHGGVRMRT
eukprot:366232-Chlamydomonas_euryale.AAC.16